MLKTGVLVGQLLPAGGCLRSLLLRLHYVPFPRRCKNLTDASMPCLSGAGWQVGAWADCVPAANVRDGRACSAGSLLAGGREHGGRVGQMQA